MVTYRERLITRQFRWTRTRYTNVQATTATATTTATPNDSTTITTTTTSSPSPHKSTAFAFLTFASKMSPTKMLKNPLHRGGSYTITNAQSTTTAASGDKSAQMNCVAKKCHTLQRGYTTNGTTMLPVNGGVSVIVRNNGGGVFSGNLNHQIRAVSSPSLSNSVYSKPKACNDGETSSSAGSNAMPSASVSEESMVSRGKATDKAQQRTAAAAAAQPPSTMTTSQSVGVLKKVKRTLYNFNRNQFSPNCTDCGGSVPHGAAEPTTALTVNGDSTCGSSGKSVFGPLIWRNSKGRRKSDRRDKCNSSDSGIQIELDGDEPRPSARMAATLNAPSDENATKTIGGRSVRRSVSAKVSTLTDESSVLLTAKTKILQRMAMFHEREAPESLPTRSISQPNGLESFGIQTGVTANASATTTTGTNNNMEDSDSDSVASHDEGPNYSPLYAEVLYSFSAAGPQELGLERGCLIEVLRKEIGPWWFGRIRKEDSSLVAEILDPELGWFPKEFVRVIQCPDTDPFYQAHCQQMPAIAMPTICGDAAPPLHPPTVTVSAPHDDLDATIRAAPSADEASPTAADATAAPDTSNITTIVIEGPPSPPAFSTDGGVAAPLGESRVGHSNNVIMDNAEILRRSAVKELLDTEINYVKLLASICEGYLPAMSKRIDIFSSHSIGLIFSNITAIYKFQRKFLDALRKAIEQNQVAKVFVKMHKDFLCYSTYCNAFPRALIELETYDRVKEAKVILDNCREAENLAELPLSAHLLAPVQRICRYPLHLAEIMKSASQHDDAPKYELQQLEQLDVSQLHIPDTRDTIGMALDAMRGITEAVNEGKRLSDTIARHQSRFQNFKGPPLHLQSTRFFLQIDATRQKQNLWNSSYTLFLFDNQLIYCKRDILKRSQFIYKGRIILDRCRVVNVPDGKMFGHTIKNSLRIYCEERNKWYDFSFRSANRKHRFISTLALERQFGGKAFYISEMSGYAFEERDCSDQSDYELTESELRAGHDGDELADTADTPQPTKSYTLPKLKTSSMSSSSTSSHCRDSLNGGGGVGGGGGGSSECQTGSLGRRRLGNWFRKPKSSHCTPNHSPTHKSSASLHHRSSSDLQHAESDNTLMGRTSRGGSDHSLAERTLVGSNSTSSGSGSGSGSGHNTSAGST